MTVSPGSVVAILNDLKQTYNSHLAGKPATRSPWGIDVCDALLTERCGGKPTSRLKCPGEDGSTYYFSRCAPHSGGPFWMDENSVEAVPDDEWTMASIMLR